MCVMSPLNQRTQQSHLRKAFVCNLLYGDLELVFREDNLPSSSQNFFVEDLGSIGKVWRLSDPSDRVIAVSSGWGP